MCEKVIAYPREEAIAYVDPGVEKGRPENLTMQPHYLRAKHGVATSKQKHLFVRNSPRLCGFDEICLQHKTVDEF